jgi:hypothetical protein
MIKGKYFVIVGVLLIAVALLLVGCSGDSVTAPETVSAPAPAAAAAPVAPEAPAAVPVPDGPAPTATVANNGTVTLNNITGHNVTRDICYFKEGPHPQELLLVGEVKASAKQSSTVPLPNDVLAEKLGLTTAECEAEGEVQVDVVKVGRCEGGSNNLGPSLIAFARHVPVTFATEEGEPKITRVSTPVSEWSECEATPNRPADCKRWRWVEVTITKTYQCREPEVVTKKKRESEACDCPDVCKTQELPAEGVYSTGVSTADIFASTGGGGNPDAECSRFGNWISNDKDEHRPWDMDPASFYLIKAGQYVRLQYNPPDRWARTVNVDRKRSISHVTACVCPTED